MISERILMRPWRESDALAHVEAVRETATDGQRWLNWLSANYQESDSLNWFAMSHGAMARDLAVDIGIFARYSGQLIGGIAINAIEKHNNVANLGYWIRSHESGKGYATEAACLMARYAFLEMSLTRLQLVIAQQNQASCRVAEKLGAHLECIAHNRVQVEGKPAPGAIYSLFPDDFV
jgi:RimJ/RimL family protein N-acetyltransferase